MKSDLLKIRSNDSTSPKVKKVVKLSFIMYIIKDTLTYIKTNLLPLMITTGIVSSSSVGLTTFMAKSVKQEEILKLKQEINKLNKELTSIKVTTKVNEPAKIISSVKKEFVSTIITIITTENETFTGKIIKETKDNISIQTSEGIKIINNDEIYKKSYSN